MDTRITTHSYGFGTVVAVPYDQAMERTRAALKEKLGAEFRPYTILGACNPPLAQRALQSELGVGLLLPCNVVVYDNGDGTSTVEAMDPEAALGIVGDNPALAEVAREAKVRLQRALASLVEAPG